MIFESFSVILRQISLGVHSHAVVHFPCLTKKSFKNRDFGSFRRYCVKFHSEYIRTLSFIFLVLRKNPSKIEILGLFGDTATNFTRSTFVRRRLFSLSYEKILQKSRLWVFSVILRQISLGVPTVRHRLFSLSYEKILQKSRFWAFAVMLGQISLGVHSYAVVYFPTERPSV